MDANNTRFHLLLGKADWMRCDADASTALAWSLGQRLPDRDALALRGGQMPEDCTWDQDTHELTLARRVFQFSAAPKDLPPQLVDRRGAACDRFGSWYWIGRSRQELRVRSAGSAAVTRFWAVDSGASQSAPASAGDFQPKFPPTPQPPALLSGLALTEDHYLVVGTLQPAGLLIFDLVAGGPPQQALWPEAVPFAPFDMAAAPGGGVWILDRDNRRAWLLDRGFNVVDAGQPITLRAEAVDAFQPKAGGALRRTAPRTFPSGITGDSAAPLVALDPVAIEVLPDGSMLLLDNSSPPFSSIHRYRLGQRLGEPVSTGSAASLFDDEQPPRLLGHDFVFVAEHEQPDSAGRVVPDRLIVATDGGNQSVAFAVTLEGDQLVLEPQAEYLPMRLFGGRGLAASNGQAFYDFGDDAGARWLPLVEQRRPRYAAEAILVTPAFDGREQDCVWHRLMLDALIPPQSEVAVFSRAGHDRRSLGEAGWRREPGLVLRPDGSELPFVRGPKTDAQAGRGTWELLLQGARGRYVQLRLVLRGDGRATPRLHGLRLYYPRFSYLTEYLPAVYREDASSASFLDRFLANFEGIDTALEDRIAAVQALFDVRSAPAEALEWLASWFGVALDPAWDEARRRLFIAHAMDFFQARGTELGLKIALRLALDECADESIFALHPQTANDQARARSIRLSEGFRTRQAQPGGLQAMAAAAHRFTVHLPVAATADLNGEALRRRMELARRIVELEKPAHTVFSVQLYWAMFRLGEARLGEDSLIAQGSRAPQLMPPMVLGQGYLAEGRLEASFPQDIANRSFVTGTTRIG